jgi:hypothetical protein
MVESEPSNVEGEVVKNASVIDRQLYAPPSKADEIKALRAEVHTLRQILYHRATYAEERGYNRFRRMSKSISTSTVAKAVNDIAARGLGVRTKYGDTQIKVAPQFVFRLAYKIVELTVGIVETRWDQKPKGLSKLKWLWQNDLLYTMPFAINAMEALIYEMSLVDPSGTKSVLKKLEQHLSKKNP